MYLIENQQWESSLGWFDWIMHTKIHSFVLQLSCMVCKLPWRTAFASYAVFIALFMCLPSVFNLIKIWELQAFSLDFNLRSHMKTHSQENYHICPYPDCGKRYAHEYKLKNHISSHHEKVSTIHNLLDSPFIPGF